MVNKETHLFIGDLSIKGSSSTIYGTGNVDITGNLNLLGSQTLVESLTISGSTSGSVSIKVDPDTGTYDFRLPSSLGTTGQTLVSTGSLTPMIWTTPITNISLSTPAFLTVSGSPLSSNGGFTLTYSGSAIPVTSGGTGVLTKTGTGSVVLNTNASLVTPDIGVATGTTLALTGRLTSTLATGTSPFLVSSSTLVSNLNSQFLSGATFGSPGVIGGTTASSSFFTNTTLNVLNISGSLSGIVSIKASSGTFDFNLPNTTGLTGQALISEGQGFPLNWITLTTGTVTSVALSAPPFLTVSGSPITSNGVISLAYSGIAIPVTSGGTGTTTSTGSGSVVLSSAPVLVSPQVSIGLNLLGSSSGIVSLKSTSGTYSFGFPETYGSAGQLLVSNGIGLPLGWVTPNQGNIQSITLEAPPFLSVSGSPMTTSGTFALTYSGTAIPVTSGGTGVITSTGTGSVVLNTNPVFSNKISISGSTSGAVSIKSVSGTFDFILPESSGSVGQTLVSDGGLGANYWTTPITSIAVSAPSFLSVSGAPLTSNGTISLTYSGVALPVSSGGTGVLTSTGIGSVVLNNSPVLINPSIGAATGTSLSVTGTLTSFVATGTPPIAVSSTTLVSNLNANFLSGATFGSPGVIGGSTPSSASFTSVSASGLSMNNQKITGVLTPTADTDAANKSYVDMSIQGLTTKNSVTSATTQSRVLSSDFFPGTMMDGRALETGDRILVKNQTNQVENGLYLINSTGPPTRTFDFRVGLKVAGSFVFVTSGTVNGDVGFICTNERTSDTVGTNNITFTQFSGAGDVIAGTGLTKTGNTFDVNAAQDHVTSIGTLSLLTVTGTTTLGGTVTAALAVGGALSVSGPTTVGAITASGVTTLLALNASGICNLGATSVASFTSVGAATLGIVNGGATTVTTLAATSTSLASLTVTGVTNLGGLAAVGIAASGALTVAGAANLSSVTVTGLTTVINMNSTGTSNLGVVTATSYAASGASALGVLTAGATTLTTLSAAATNLASLTVAGVTSLAGLSVVGLAASGSMTVAGAASLSSLTVSGLTTVINLNSTGTCGLGIVTATSYSASGASALGVLSAGATTLTTLSAAATNLMSLTVSGVSNFAGVGVVSIAASGAVAILGPTTVATITASGLGTFVDITASGNCALGPTSASSLSVSGSLTLGILTATSTTLESLVVNTSIACKTISVAGATSGVITIKPQAIAGTYNFNLPTSAGTTGQVLTSGGGTTIPTYWSTLPVPIIWIIMDQKPNGTNGGDFLIGTWNTRTLNTITTSTANSLVTISSNQITLAPGNYTFESVAQAYNVGNHMSRLYNVTTALVHTYGTSEISGTTGSSSFISTVISISVSTSFTLEHRASTIRINTGLGSACGFGNMETYVTCKISQII